MRAIALDELPQYTPWPERLLGLGDTVPSPRTPERIAAEYDQGVYVELAEAVLRAPTLSIEEVRLKSLPGDPTREVAMSIGSALYATTLSSAIARSEDVHLRRIGASLRGVRTVVDLGCGYGHLLARFRLMYPASDVTLRGGDISASAVGLTRHFGVEADTFSFLADVCEPLEQAEPPILVLTAYALHQLPSAAPAVELLARYRDKIAAVVCLEPEADWFGPNLLGLLRHAYGRANDYSADLLHVLKARSDVRIEYYVPNAVGANCLLPGTISTWRFQ